MTPLFKKLNLGTHKSLWILNAPESFDHELDPLTGVTIDRSETTAHSHAFAIGFAITRAELNQISKLIVNTMTGDVIAWIAYPKKSSTRYRCEFDRDHGWEILGDAGFEPVRQIAIDDDWTALRFRRVEHIKSLSRSTTMAISPAGKRRTKR